MEFAVRSCASSLLSTEIVLLGIGRFRYCRPAPAPSPLWERPGIEPTGVERTAFSLLPPSPPDRSALALVSRELSPDVRTVPLICDDIQCLTDAFDAHLRLKPHFTLALGSGRERSAKEPTNVFGQGPVLGTV